MEASGLEILVSVVSTLLGGAIIALFKLFSKVDSNKSLATNNKEAIIKQENDIKENSSKINSLTTDQAIVSTQLAALAAGIQRIEEKLK